MENKNLKTALEIDQVNNTADVNKPVSTAQAAADTAVYNGAVQRANHTGSQPISSVTNLQTELNSKLANTDATVRTAVASATNTATNVTTLADADVVGARRSSDGSWVKMTYLNLRTQLTTLFNGLYARLASDNTFTAQISAPNQVLDAGSRVVTRELMESALIDLPNIRDYPAFGGGNSGAGSIADLNNTGLGFPLIGAGTDVDGYAYAEYAKQLFQASTWSGAGIRFNLVNFEFSGWFRARAASTSTCHHLFLVGQSGTPASLSSDQLDDDGVGFEIAYDNNGTTPEVRLIYHDGTIYKTSDWFPIPTDFSVSTWAYKLTTTATGEIKLYLKRTVGNATLPSLHNESPIITVTDGPTGSSGNFKDTVRWMEINDGTTVSGFNGLRTSPVRIRMTVTT